MKTYYRSFPMEVAYIIQALTRPLGKNQAATAFLDRGDLLVRLKGADHITQLIGKRVLVIWANAKRTPTSTDRDRRPVITLRVLAEGELPVGELLPHERLLEFLLAAMEYLKKSDKT